MYMLLDRLKGYGSHLKWLRHAHPNFHFLFPRKRSTTQFNAGTTTNATNVDRHEARFELPPEKLEWNKSRRQ